MGPWASELIFQSPAMGLSESLGPLSLLEEWGEESSQPQSREQRETSSPALRNAMMLQSCHHPKGPWKSKPTLRKLSLYET